MSLYTIVSRKFACVFVKKAAWKSANTGNTAVVKVGSYIVSVDTLHFAQILNLS